MEYTWDDEENVPVECGEDNGTGGYNRFIDVPGADSVLTAFCYSSCEPCGNPPVEVDVTFNVDMSEQLVSPDGVHITGSFQGWDPALSPMTNMGQNIYAATFTLWSNETHQYKFINGNTWDGKETVPPECGVDDGQGGYNRYLNVPETDSTLTDVCFNSCDPCVTGIGARQKTVDGNLTVFPNPFTQALFINYQAENKGLISIILTDPYGKMVRKADFVQKTGVNYFSMQLDELSQGIYFLRVESLTNNQLVTQKVKILKKR